MSDYGGLSLVARTGVRWIWAGYQYVRNRRGEPVRLERWQAPCRACDAPFEVLARVPGVVRRQYEKRLAAGEYGVSYRVPADKCMRALELRNCPQHRGAPDPAKLV